MNRKTLRRGGALLLILIVLATGCGSSVTTPTPTPTTPTPTITPPTTTTPPPTTTPALIPSHTGSPVISMDIAHLMQGQFSHLAIYDDGYVIRNEERGLRMPAPERPPTSSWYAGQLETEELAVIIDFFQSSGFMELNDSYTFAGEPISGGGKAMGDNFVTISISYGDLQKTVVASFYLAYEDMPSPLNEIYDRLWGVALETSYVTSKIISN
jgi:hypothetical protein